MASGEVISLFIFLVQELGVLLGVGSALALLVIYVLGVHKEQYELEHRYFAKAARRVVGVGLFLIVVSGAYATFLHYQADATEILFAPAFIFKWALILIVLSCLYTDYFLEKWQIQGTPKAVLEGWAGANWLALFLVHTVAPQTTWMFLLELYVGWLVFFACTWVGTLLLMKHGNRHSGLPALIPPKQP